MRPLQRKHDGGVSKTLNASRSDSDHQPVICVEYCGDKTDASCSTEKAYCIPKNPVDGRQQAVCFQSCGDRANPSVSVSDTAYCIPANPMSDRQQAVCIPLTNRGVACEGGVCETVRAESHGALPLICIQQNQREEVRELGELPRMSQDALMETIGMAGRLEMLEDEESD